MPFAVHANHFGRPRDQFRIVPHPPSQLQQQVIIAVPADKFPLFIFLGPIMEAGLCWIEVSGEDVYSVVSIIAAIGRIDRREPFPAG